MSDSRVDFPIGTEVEFIESGQEALVVSIEEQDKHEDYQSDSDVFVLMNGLVTRTDASKIRRG